MAYAAARHIVVIPEIDMPAHATAATRAHPEVSGGGTGRWKGFTFHPARDSTYEFIEDVLTEAAGLFPGPWLHIGADEVSYGNQSWKTDPEIQQFIREHNLENELGLEHYFVRRMHSMTFPRLAALAEAAWTPDNVKQWPDFESHLPGYLRELGERNVFFFDPFAPATTPEPTGPDKQDVLADG